MRLKDTHLTHTHFKMIDTEVVFFALDQCNNGTEMLEYIDNLLEAINED